MISNIARFMEPEDIASWRNENTLALFSLTSKKIVEQIFNITGHESISDNEVELAGVMRLARTSHDDLMLYLFRTFCDINRDQQFNYRPNMLIKSVERDLSKICYMKF
jgi:hypothetical protein